MWLIFFTAIFQKTFLFFFLLLFSLEALPMGKIFHHFSETDHLISLNCERRSTNSDRKIFFNPVVNAAILKPLLKVLRILNHNYC
jgi:hypothetical protein